MVLAGTVALGACGTTAKPPAPTPVPPPPLRAPAPAGRVLDYVPAAGLRWLLFARPRLAAHDPELSPQLQVLFPVARLQAFAGTTGVHLTELPAGAIAGYDFGVLYLAELAGSEALEARELFAAGLVDGGIARRRSSIERIVGTSAKGEVRALVTVDDRYLAVASGDTTLAKIVEAYAEHRLRSPSALDGAALSTLPPLPDDALLAFFAPGPFDDEWARAAGGLLDSALAVSIVARKHPAGGLEATLNVAGDWGERAEEGRGELERAWTTLRTSSTGKLFALDRAEESRSAANPQSLTLSAKLPLAGLVRGLRDATNANVWEILDLATPQSPR